MLGVVGAWFLLCAAIGAIGNRRRAIQQEIRHYKAIRDASSHVQLVEKTKFIDQDEVWPSS